MSDRPHLRRLARRVGIYPGYYSLSGERRLTSTETRVRLLQALGFPASDEAAAERSLADLEQREVERLLAPVAVIFTNETDELSVRATLPPSLRPGAAFVIELYQESGVIRRVEGTVPDGPPWRIPLGRLPEPGYHRLRLTVQEERQAEQLLIVAPDVCLTPRELVGERRALGLWANLYALRSAKNWGVGDLRDLREVVEWCGRMGGDFVGLNPLHALHNRFPHISPYSPVSRLFRNVLYLDVEAVPELAQSEEAQRLAEAPELRAALARLRARDLVDYAGVQGAKRPILEELHWTFARLHRDRETPRGRQYAAYLEREGEALTDFATFLALDEHFKKQDEALTWWKKWPPGFGNPQASNVRWFRRRHFEEVDFHRYLQFELDRQTAEVAKGARAAGMPIGLYTDLAVGSGADGSDVWAFPGLFVEGAHLGAPPDDLAATGQDWNLLPVHPLRLEERHFDYTIQLLRANLRNAGALRIDHAIGLMRQFWIPEGSSGTEGAYMRMPLRAILAILVLESHRAKALIVGEDLGTVPRGLRPKLARRAVLQSKVILFERDHAGGFVPSAHYAESALVTANTHDMPTIVGWWEGRDRRLRRELGSIANDEALGHELRHRDWEHQRLLERLRAEGLLPAASEAPSPREVTEALHAFAARTPCRLAGLSLGDLAGELDPVNVPGARLEHYPSWQRKMSRTIEELREDASLREHFSRVRAERDRGCWPSGERG
ncbi:MAG: 4-alpha-glucanotransferase [Planctomycetota bacterium]